MKLKAFLLLSLICTGLVGCKKDKPTHKVIDALPIKTDEVVVPAYAVQHMMLLRKNLMKIMVTILNKTMILNPSYPELSGTGPSYTLTVQENRIEASATYTIQFFDINDTQIDPIATQSSSATIKSVTFSKSGGTGSALFPTLSDSGTLTLNTTNYAPNAPIRLTGTMSLSNPDYSIPFVISSPGSHINSEGLRDGGISVAGGTGPNGPITMSLGVSDDHSIDGPIVWEGQEGSLHLSDSGAGFVISSNARIPIN